jgi:hypothetical protein
VNNCYRGEAINITYLSGCVLALACVRVGTWACWRTRMYPCLSSMQSACVIFCLQSVTTKFSTLSQNRDDFRKKILNKKYVLLFALQFCLEYFLF